MATEKKSAMDGLTLVKTHTLSDGKELKVFKGKGKHHMAAARMAAGDQGMVTPSMMSQLVLINDEQLVPEDFAELDLDIYLEVIEQFSEVNFTR